MAQPSSDADDLSTLVTIGFGIAFLVSSAGAAAFLTTAWSTSLHWLLEHKVVVARNHDPIITVPHAGGAGLDYARCFVLAAIVLLLIGGTVQSVRRSRARSQEQV